ncbi:MAG: protoglobin domain-containing protein [Bacillota bacterium]
MSFTLEQGKIDELVERFYSKLTKDSYFSSMFAERGVDIELLKSRQRTFISRLVSEDSSKAQADNVSQVNERHPFQTTPERGIWIHTMEEAMNEMRLDDSNKELLLEKMKFLMNKLIS